EVHFMNIDEQAIRILANVRRNFHDVRSPEEFRYFSVYTDDQTLTPVLPVGQSPDGNLLFVDEFDLTRAVISGGEVDVYEDTRHLVKVLPTEVFEPMRRNGELLS